MGTLEKGITWLKRFFSRKKGPKQHPYWWWGNDQTKNLLIQKKLSEEEILESMRKLYNQCSRIQEKGGELCHLQDRTK